MELGISTLLWYEEADLAPYLPLLEAEGIRLIEIRRSPHHFDYANAFRTRQLSSALQEHGVVIHSLHVPDNLCTDISVLDGETRKHAVAEVEKIARALAEIGGKILVIHAGGILEDESERQEQLEASRHSLSELSAYCKEVGLKVAVENSLPTRKRVGDTVAEIVELVEKVGAENLGICLDTSHANIGEDVVRAVRLVQGRLFHLHISDNSGRHDEHALPFEGSIDWRGFMAAISTTGYEGVFMLEVRARRDPKTILRKAKKVYQRLIKMRRISQDNCGNQFPQGRVKKGHRF